MKNDNIKKPVREFYAKVATQGSPCCALAKSQCGGWMGYTDEELKGVPEGSNLGLSIGNPVAPASLREGEIVLDLGSGPGFDCFIAANKVGKSGRIIGLDMTPEMIDRARENAERGNYKNVEFRLGEIENLPVADNSVDVVISNCVINLVSDKGKVFREMFRVLKPGGRFVISDVVLLKELPDFLKNSVGAYVGCIAGAAMKDEYIGAIKAAGFQDVRVIDKVIDTIDETSFPAESMLGNKTPPKKVKANRKDNHCKFQIVNSVARIKVQGVKPI
jgi:SAM-dependent methyltransferase